MNAMEMMMKAALDKLIANIPPETLEQVQQIGQFVKRLDQRLDRIEANQQLIMAALKIPPNIQQEQLGHVHSPGTDGTPGQSERSRFGSSEV